MTASEAQIQHNVRVHDRVARRYERIHGEIYNPIEQQRLQEKLGTALALVRTPGQAPRALDFGCGAGNLTHHLLNHGAHVTAADISAGFLDLVRSKFAASGRFETFRLNGKDLAGLPDESFDLAATYSVLHHVPDYLAAVREMARVVKAGGVLYLDHEVNPSYWAQTEAYLEFRKLAVPQSSWLRYLKPDAYLNRIIRTVRPAYFDEGDIHVHPHDHIEWDRIESYLTSEGWQIVSCEDYLLYRRGCPQAVYDAYRERCSDLRMLIARKPPSP